jgi:hypothetical protein
MGEKQNQPFQLSFNASLKVDFQGSRVTSNGGLVLVRELDERLGLSELVDQHLIDSRGKNTQLSCHRFRSNQVRLALSLLAYNLGNLWRRLALPQMIENWSLTSLRQRLVKTGGGLVKYARYYWLLLAEGHLNRRRFGAMLGRIALLPLRTG